MAILSTRFKLRNSFKLKGKEDIRHIFNAGNKKLQKSSIVFYIKSTQFRFLISFKKRLLNSARRNNLKRQIKEFIRLNQYNLKTINCAILIVRRPSSKCQLYKELEFLLQ
ncbi:MAG: ribonuclease P protein component [Deltaproteobacteria bacterium]|nr:ribonuclease P protein component [Deltaproteobacteria bacterium]